MFENIKKLFKKEETPEEKMKREIEEEFKKQEKKLKERAAREEKIMDCRAVLEECYKFFQNLIIIENARTRDLEEAGLFDNDHRDRVREAAIGMLITKQAIIKLERVNTDGELNSTINQMGMALRQIQRLDDSSNAISLSTRKTLKKWYPYPLEENEADREKNTQLVIPQNIRDRIDDEFISGLIEGDSFDECLERSSHKKKNEASKVKSRMDQKMDAINRVCSGNGERDKDLNKRVADRFKDSI